MNYLKGSSNETNEVLRYSFKPRKRGFPDSQLSAKTSFSSSRINEPKLVTPSDGSQVSLDTPHIILLKIPRKFQKEIRCEVGTDIFMEIPWKVITKTEVFDSINKDQSDSPFTDYAPVLKAYPEEEILLGMSSFDDTDIFLLAVSLHGRNGLLEELKSSHLDKIEKIRKLLSFSAGAWKSLGSDGEIDKIKNTRPFISYDCYIKKNYHDKKCKDTFTCSHYYTELKGGDIPSDNIEGKVFHKYVQVTPEYNVATAQTIPEIPVNSITQFTLDMRIIENEEKLNHMCINWENINERLLELVQRMENALTYNEEYDLYRNDYEILGATGNEIKIHPNISYKHFSTMVTLRAGRSKAITGTSWHPDQPGYIAVAYGQNFVANIKEMHSDLDDKTDIDTDVYEVELHRKEAKSFDDQTLHIWKEELIDLKNNYKKPTSTHYYDLAKSSIEFLKQAKIIRQYQINEFKKMSLSTSDIEDLFFDEEYQYTFFEDMKKKSNLRTEKDEDSSCKLKGDLTVKNKFHNGKCPSSEAGKEQSVPKEKCRSNLFHEIWFGDFWHFGEDLKHMTAKAIEDSIGSVISSLGLPKIPKTKLFLPAHNKEEFHDCTLKLDDLIGSSSKVKGMKKLSFQNNQLTDEDFHQQNMHSVAIWNIENDIKPAKSLVSAFEISSLSFCPHNGRFLVGGTTTGQVVLWDIEDIHCHEKRFSYRPDFDTIGFNNLEENMHWFKHNSSENIYVSALSDLKSSHKDRVLDITWLSPNIKISTSTGAYEDVEPEEEFSLQFMSTSADGRIKYWDLSSSPMLFIEPSDVKYSFKCSNNFKIPDFLLKTESKYSPLFLRWEPIFEVQLERLNCENIAARCYHITSICHEQFVTSFENLKSDSDEQNHNQFFTSKRKVNYETIVGTVDGHVIQFKWKPPLSEEVMVEPLKKNKIVGTVSCLFKPIHDGPVTSVSRHRKMKDVFISAGGHVFALWKSHQEWPLKWKKYPDCYITAVGWDHYRPSIFRVGRSDGQFEEWDLFEDGNEAKINMSVTSRKILDFLLYTSSALGLFGVCDDEGILKFYSIPNENKVERANETQLFFEKIEKENMRKNDMALETVEYKSEAMKIKAKDIKKEEQELKLKEQQSPKKLHKRKFAENKYKPYKEELYKWYLRRRGSKAKWLDDLEKQWYNREEEYMIKTILHNKKIDMEGLEKLITPLYQKEKHERDIEIKILDILDMADDIFKQACKDLKMVEKDVSNLQISKETETADSGKLNDIMAEVDLYFGESYQKFEEELEIFVQMHKVEKEWTFTELCEKNQFIRDFWNDRRRFLNPDYKWLYEFVEENLEQCGYKLTYYVDHEESYIIKKYKRKIENIAELKKKFGEDYDPYWDLIDNSYKSSEKGRQVKQSLIIKDESLQTNMGERSDVSNSNLQDVSKTEIGENVEKSGSVIQGFKQDELESIIEKKGGEEKELNEATKEKYKFAVRFEEQIEFSERLQGRPENYQNNDAQNQYHDIPDLQRIVKEKKMQGEEIIDIDDISGSYESIPGSIASSSPSPDMSLKSDSDSSERYSIDEDNIEEEFREYFEGIPPCYEPPKIIPFDFSLCEEEPTEEWMEDLTTATSQNKEASKEDTKKTEPLLSE